MEVLIYIPENKIPKNLGGCSVEISFCGGHVSQVVMVDRYDEEGLDFTELPKGHGDLIDAECVKKQFNGKEGEDFTAFHFYDAVDNVPTIIPADKDGENRDGMELL